MIDVFYDIDHILLVDNYRNPQKHRHLAKYILISLSGKMNCII